MSRPIDIPGNASKRQRRSVPQNATFFGEGPYFGFIEIFESGNVRRMVSNGLDGYVEVQPRARLPPLAFVTQKDRISGEITLEIASATLKRSIQQGLQSHFAKPPLKIDFELVLHHYDALKLHLDFLQSYHSNEDATAEVGLLIHDLLPERALYEGIGLEPLRQQGLISSCLVQDIYQRGIHTGLDEIGDYCSLGIVPEKDHERYLERFNAHFADIARSGDYLALQDLCESVAGAGEIEFQYNPELLLELLDHGHLEAYLYILDLVNRTRPGLTGTWDPNISDVSLEPMFVAIRLGHLPVVETFVGSNTFFEGRLYKGNQPINGHVFTPLFAAVFWGHRDIVRLLLRSGPVYSPGYHQAAAFALLRDMQDILQLFTENETFESPGSLLSSFPASWIAPTIQQASGNTNSFGVQQSFVHPQVTQHMPEATPGLPYPDDLASISSLSVSVPVMKGPFEARTIGIPDLATSLPNELLTSTGDRPTRPYGSSSEPEGPPPLAKETDYHKSRRQKCRGAVSRLEGMLEKLKVFCFGKADDFGDLLRLPLTEQVWASGVNGFKGIVKNRAPSGLAETVHCLLLADALIYQLPAPSELLQSQFYRDLERWRSILSMHDQDRFDQLAAAIWDPKENVATPSPPPSSEDLYYFQELIQHLVDCEDRNTSAQRNSRRPGSRLRNLQLRGQPSANVSTDLNCPFSATDSPFDSIGTVLGRLTVNDESPGDQFDLCDFLHLDELQEDTEEANAELADVRKLLRSLRRAAWKQVDSTVVLLLASVAFAVVLMTASVFHGCSTEEHLDIFGGSMSGYRRSAIIVESFFDIPASMSQGPRSTRSKSRHEILNMKAAASGDNFEGTVVQPLGSQASSHFSSVGSQGGSSFLSTSPEATRVTEKPTCTKCSKKFSSISNRNKHEREGCSLRKKKGYPCRNRKCTSVLTTDWYRGKHEQTRCRFRR